MSGSLSTAGSGDVLLRSCDVAQIEKERNKSSSGKPRGPFIQNILKDVIIGEYTNVTRKGQARHEEVDPELGDRMIPLEVDPGEPPRSRRRIKGKQPPSEIYHVTTEQPCRMKLRELLQADTGEDLTVDTSAPGKSPEDYAFTAMRMTESAFFTFEESPQKVVEIAFPAIETPSRLRAYLRSPEGFVVTSLRKKRVDINEKKLSPEEREMIRFAKGKEVKEFQRASRYPTA